MAGMATDEEVTVLVDSRALPGHLTIPAEADSVVVFAHGSGSGRHSPRNQFVAKVLQEAGLGTLLFDLLTPQEEADRANVFDIELLAQRLSAATAWLRGQVPGLSIGWFGASTGAGAALWAAAEPDAGVSAIVSRGGRPDLAGERLRAVEVPTLLIVGGLDTTVIELNRTARAALRGESRLAIVPGATHLFEEPGTLDIAAGLARDWFKQRLGARSGFRLMPHTADVRISAWAPTVDGCLAQAAQGLVASFADTASAQPQRLVPFTCDPAPELELLVELLEEVIYVVDAEDAVPVTVSVSHTTEGGLTGEFAVADRSTVEVVGPAPKAVTRHGLILDHDDSTWRCQAIVDV